MKLRNGTVRALAKTLTYRVMCGLEAFGVAYFLTGKLSVAFGVVGAEFFFKTATYFGHEKAWEHFGKKGATAHA